MMKKTLILLCCACIAKLTFAQNPGHMGNHIIFNADVTLSPSWKNPNPLSNALSAHYDNEHTKKYLGLNYFITPNVEAIIWKKGSVGAGYNYYNSPYQGFSVSNTFHLQSSGSYFEETYDNSGVIVAHGFNVFYKQYFGDTQAPLGWYAKVTFDGLFYQYKVTQEIPQWTAYYNLIDTVAFPTSGRNAIFGFKTEVGYDYLFFNRLRLSMGLTLGTTFGGYKLVKNSIKDDFMYDAFYDTSVTTENIVRNRILNAYWFGIKIGIGILAF